LHAHHDHWLVGSGSNVAFLHSAGEGGAATWINRRPIVQTLAVLAAGLALWIGYGVLKGDYVIIAANAVGLALVATLIGFKIRDGR
jgi:hypothetical protein